MLQFHFAKFFTENLIENSKFIKNLKHGKGDQNHRIVKLRQKSHRLERLTEGMCRLQRFKRK